MRHVLGFFFSACLLASSGAFAADCSQFAENLRQKADKPLSRMVYWSIRPTACPEAYLRVNAEPGKSTAWRITWDFYTTK